MKDTHISSSMFIVRVLHRPLDAPWSTGRTWMLVAFATIVVWAGLPLWWVIPSIFTVLVLVGGIMRSKVEDEKWNDEQVHTLQKHLVWMIDNRNSLAQLAGVRYMGAFLDTNDVKHWQLSTAPQEVDHDGVFEIRGKAAFNIARAAAGVYGSPGGDGSEEKI